MNEIKCECRHRDKFISPDFQTILCDAHMKKKVNHHEYIKITEINDHLNTILDQFETTFIDLKTCLAVVEMFLKEERALKLDLSKLKKLQQKLDEEMENLNERFKGGTF
jgi:cell division protein FtsB